MAPANPQRLIGAAVLSASALLLEIVLTRLFSVLFFPPYVFLVISIAIFGIGIGAAAPALRPAMAGANRLPLYACGGTLSALLLLAFAVLGASLDLQIILFPLLALPFFFFGLAMSSLFSQSPGASRLLYMSDLFGAGVAALIAIPLLDRFGAINAALVAAMGFAIAGLYLVGRRNRWIVALCIGLPALLFGGNLGAPFLEIDMASLATRKAITAPLNADGRILQSHWDAFARTDLVEPGDGGPLRIYVDGGAASIMPSAGARQDLIRDVGFFPFATEQPERVFIIGPGAGLDVYFALQGNAKTVTAVEVNPASVALVDEWRGLNGDLYNQPEVELVIDDGRSALRRATEDYDLIYLSQVVTLAAERGGYALSENTIYTAEAFADYLARLKDGGQIALKLYDEITLTRAVSTALAALRGLGLTDQEAMKHLVAIVDEKSDPPVPLLMIGAAPYTEDDSLVLGAIAHEVGFRPLLLPHVLARPPLDAVDSGEASFATLVDASPEDISPPTDNRPYFFQFERGIPKTLIPLTIVVAFVILVLLALHIRQWSRREAPATRLMPAFFAMLGLGFIALEIYAIQQTRLFLGHPTYAVTIVLATFLVGGGLGSGMSQVFFRDHLDARPHLTNAAATASIAILALAWSLVWPLIAQELLAASMLLRFSAVIILTLPLAMCMGIPFPQALDFIGRGDRRQVAVAWSVNGLMTVAGSVVAVLLSITTGFASVLWLGCVAYVLATLILIFVHRQAET
ncbi:MAG: hypothetical protein OXN94_07155 [Chloroflexota bacterium]|nr:hypothetical protein [Chloroflexota bacterium]